jgi:hypothetical protein
MTCLTHPLQYSPVYKLKLCERILRVLLAVSIAVHSKVIGKKLFIIFLSSKSLMALKIMGLLN